MIAKLPTQLRTFDEIFQQSSPTVIQRPYIIAEAGVNHEGSMELAKRLVDEAAEGGAHAIKFQSYKAKTLASRHSPYYWDISKEPTQSQFELFQKYDNFWKNEYEELKKHCDQAGIEFMSTAFDVESARFLNDLMPVFKISSSDITNLPFIEYQCQFGKPILLSTGASYTWEIQQAVELIQAQENPLCLMHCILNYPTENANAHLGMLLDLKQKFPDAVLGYSDHTLPGEMEVLKIATLLGAKVIEKHFSHDKTLPGNDHYHAMDKEDLKHFFRTTDEVFELLGSFTKAPLPSEDKSRKNARRSLVAVSAIPAGTILTKKHLTWKRPAHGVSPKFLEEILGKTTAVDILEDDLIQWNMLQ
ncbi:MAG: N-acetylneuraminate synthase family protein [Bacteroidota bacterium]